LTRFESLKDNLSHFSNFEIGLDSPVEMNSNDSIHKSMMNKCM